MDPGSSSSALVCGADLGPTILDVTGMRPLRKTTRVSLLRELRDEKTEGRKCVFAERGWRWGSVSRTDGLDLSRSVSSKCYRYRYIYNALPNYG